MNIVKPQATFKQVLEAMGYDKKTNLPSGFAVVVDERSQVVGVISDSDIRKQLIVSEDIQSEIIAENIMRKDFIYIYDYEVQNQNYLRLINSFKSRGIDNIYSIKFLPVLNGSFQLVRIILMSELIPIINTQKEEVVIVGLGYVGLTLAISIALKGLRVIGVDRNTEMLDNLEKYEAPIHEPGIKMLLRKTIGQNLKISNLNNFEEKLEGGFTRCYILCIGTPVISGKVKTEQLYESLDFLLKHLKRGDTVILRSTVPIGFSRSIANYLASKSGLTIGVDFYFGYAPERTVEGNAIEECSSIPQLYSGYTEVCSQKIVAVFSKISNSQIKCESLESGEFGKLMTNTYRDVIFGFSNEMALIANEYNLDINRLIDEVNLGYQRNQIKKPSPGVGGPCLSKDTYILMSGGKNDFKIIESARSVNKLMPKFVSNKILNYSKINKITRILVVGLAFKGFPETKDIRNSPSVEIVRQICNKNIEVKIFDNVLTNDDLINLNCHGFYALDGNWSPQMVCILNNHIDNFKFIEDLLKLNTSFVIFDPWYLCNSIYGDSKIKDVLTLSKIWSE